MKSFTFIAKCCLFFYSIFIYGQAENKEVLVSSVSGAITIDGSGIEPQWQKAPWQSDFWMWRPTDSLAAQKQTRFKIIRDENYLYLLVELETNGTNFTTPNLKRDFSTFGADYLTLLFDTFSDATNAFSFTTNPLGLKSDGLISGGNQDYRNSRNFAWDTK